LPKEITIDNLISFGAKVYRTDLNGTIKITSDGQWLKIKKEH